MDMCRTCLKTPADRNISELNNKYPNIMSFCLDIKVPADSKITTNLCYCCYRKIITFYKFKTRSLKNDAYLKTLDPSQLVDQKQVLPNENGVKQENEELGECPVEYDKVEIKIEIDNVKDDETLADVGFESDEEPLSAVQKVKYEFIKEETEVKAPKKRGRPKRAKHLKQIKLEKEERQVCEECGKSVRDLRAHSLQHRPREERKMLRCKACPKVFISLGGRNRHYKAAHLGLKFKCDICNKEVQNLPVHKLQVHNQHALRYACVLCSRRFVAQSTLDFHMLGHTKDYAFECDVCHKKLRSKSFLSRHIRQVHEKERSHQCHVCSKAFFKKDALHRHMRVHTNERPYSCEECGKAFSDKKTLQNHVLTHAGVKSFRCKICDAAFVRSGYLKVHMISHTKEKRYPCRYCGVRFGRSDHRTRHEFTAHQKHLAAN